MRMRMRCNVFVSWRIYLTVGGFLEWMVSVYLFFSAFFKRNANLIIWSFTYNPISPHLFYSSILLWQTFYDCISEEKNTIKIRFNQLDKANIKKYSWRETERMFCVQNNMKQPSSILWMAIGFHANICACGLCAAWVDREVLAKNSVEYNRIDFWASMNLKINAPFKWLRWIFHLNSLPSVITVNCTMVWWSAIKLQIQSAYQHMTAVLNFDEESFGQIKARKRCWLEAHFSKNSNNKKDTQTHTHTRSWTTKAIYGSLHFCFCVPENVWQCVPCLYVNQTNTHMYVHIGWLRNNGKKSINPL